jgi:hypothetical protein
MGIIEPLLLKFAQYMLTLDIRKVTEIEPHKLKLVDDFIEKNKSNFSPIEFYLKDKIKK